MRAWLGLLLLCVPLSAEAGWLVTEKATGAVVNYNDHSTKDQSLRDAVSSGAKANTLTVREVTAEEWAVVFDQMAMQERQATQAAKQPLIDKIKAKWNLTDQEFEELRAAVR